MITFAELGRYGRLGNQLFQYAALKAIALENNYKCKIPNPETMEWHGQKCLLSEFNIECDFLTEMDIETIKHLAVEPSHHKYYKDFLTIPDNTNIHGYFQSTYYFEKHKDQICRELTPKKKYLQFAEEYLTELKEDGSEIVSIHLRRGDLVTNEEYLNFYGKDDIYDENSVYGNYISKAVKRFDNKKIKFLVFSGGSRNGCDTEDISWAKRTFKKDNFFVSETNDPMKDFSLILSCHHNITCHLTTFGWWGAYLNPNPDKIVVAPKNYFYNMATDYERAGFLPRAWELM